MWGRVICVRPSVLSWGRLTLRLLASSSTSPPAPAAPLCAASGPDMVAKMRRDKAAKEEGRAPSPRQPPPPPPPPPSSPEAPGLSGTTKSNTTRTVHDPRTHPWLSS
jgi:hypothetical protein